MLAVIVILAAVVRSSVVVPFALGCYCFGGFAAIVIDVAIDIFYWRCIAIVLIVTVSILHFYYRHICEYYYYHQDKIVATPQPHKPTARNSPPPKKKKTHTHTHHTDNEVQASGRASSI